MLACLRSHFGNDIDISLHIRIYKVMQIDYGREKVRFVSTKRYMGGADRFDPVEVKLENEPNHPAQVVFYFQNIADPENITSWALVH